MGAELERSSALSPNVAQLSGAQPWYRMEPSELSLLLAIVGLGLMLAHAQTAKVLAMSKLSSLLGLLTLPIVGAALWKLSLGFGWWTIAVFVAVSLVVGTVHAVVMRKFGRHAAFAAQTFCGVAGTALIGASWLIG